MRLSFFALCVAGFGLGPAVAQTESAAAAAAGCRNHEIDFIITDGDQLRLSVEEEIVGMLADVGITVNTRLLGKEEFNAASRDGDFHMQFSETWGAPYDPHAFAKGWIANDEGSREAMSGLEAPNDRETIFNAIEAVLREEDNAVRVAQWENIHTMVHDGAVYLPLWGSRIPTVLNTNRLTNFRAGYQQFDYPVQELLVVGDDKTITIAPGAQTGLFRSVGRMDPHTYRPNEFFSNNWVYEGLVEYGPFGQILPSLALSWESEDLEAGGQRYTFQLRPNVTFHDGAEWNCDAAKLNFDHVLAGPLRGPDWHGWYGLMDQIDAWECESEMVFSLTTKDKYYPILQELTFIRPLRMLSPMAFAGTDPMANNSCHAGWGTIVGEVNVTCSGATNISGTGPFVFESRTPGTIDGETVDDEVVFRANTNYWDSDAVPDIDTLVVRRYDDSDAVKAALLDGSLDLMWGSGVLTAADLVELDEDETNDLTVYHSDDIQNVIITINTGNPPLDDINLRKTIIHAVNKQKIIDDTLGGLYTPVDNVFPKDAPYSDVEFSPAWNYDLEQAMLLNCMMDEEASTTEEESTPEEPAAEESEPSESEGSESEPSESSTSAHGLGLGLGAAALVLTAIA